MACLTTNDPGDCGCEAPGLGCCGCAPCSIPIKDLRWAFTADDPIFPFAGLPSYAPGGDHPMPAGGGGICQHQYDHLSDDAGWPPYGFAASFYCGESGVTAAFGDGTTYGANLTPAHPGFSATCYPFAATWTLSPDDGDTYNRGFRTITVYDPGPSYERCPCCVPDGDRTLVMHTYFGDYTATLAQVGATKVWASGCSSGMIFTIACDGPTPALEAKYFISGGCPGGVAATCDSAPGGGLVLASLSCGPFAAEFAVDPAGCPALADNGITGFSLR